jgi:hypothetical protein
MAHQGAGALGEPLAGALGEPLAGNYDADLESAMGESERINLAWAGRAACILAILAILLLFAVFIAALCSAF